MNETESLTSLWPILVYAGGVVLLITIMLGASYFLGERHQETVTDTVYESGIKVTGDAWFKFPVHFYILAMFFVIFDLEVVFIVAWAINARALGWEGYLAIATFIGSLVAILIYVWRIGALDFGPSGNKILKHYHQQYKNKPEQILKKSEENKIKST
ncbi:MAG: NADH-quinone oxidoreductase subunit A [Bacteroidia bacterium]|nr:NADH-quinone oxidoreductase subunit A [Bacteroidia bacterium]MCZ2278230.1 NADH-quinone oxidoreductase subunit A [Bacteroidia bacterium]